MNRAIICPQCKEHCITESMVKGGEYECLNCGVILRDTENYELHNESENKEEFLEWFYRNNMYNDFNGLLIKRDY